MSFKIIYCCSLNDLLEKLENLKYNGYTYFRGQSDASKQARPNAFRDPSLKKFEQRFPARTDCLQWPECDATNQIVKSYLRTPIQKLPSQFSLQHKRLSQYLIHLMQYNHRLTRYYCSVIKRGYIKLEQLPEYMQNLLKNHPLEFWIDQNTFVKWLRYVLLTATPSFDADSNLVDKPHLEQELTGYDQTWPQHYGFPSAALDWSKNPYIALYFATNRYIDSDFRLKSEQSGSAIQRYKQIPNSRSAIFAYKEIENHGSPIKIMEPDNWLTNLRAQAQEGVFTYFTEPFLFFLARGSFPSIEDYSNSAKFELIRLDIEPTQQDITGIRKVLLDKNINKNTMFPK